MDPGSIEEFRAEARRHAAAQPVVMAHLPTGTGEHLRLPGEAPVFDVTVYRPASAAERPGVFVNLHGGGFVLGDASVDDRYCRYLADRAGCVLVNVDYPLAPEHPFPAAVEYTDALIRRLAERGTEAGLDTTRMAIGGHSAGGNLSAAACLLAKERGGPALRGQVLDYPPLDLVTPPSRKRAPLSPDDAAAEARIGERFNAWYLRSPRDAANPLASPVLAEDLTGLPPALVITAEADSLRAEGDRYAERLADAGVATEHVVYTGCRHGFTHTGPEDQAVHAWDRMADFLRRALA